MADKFKSGVRSVPVGVEEFTVTGIGASFTPTSAQVSVRQPADAADIITAYIAGSITADGFTVVLSAPAGQTGYLLDFTLYSSEGVSPTSADALVISYDDLKSKVAYFVGWNPSSLTTAQTDKVDEIIQSGVRRFYYPPAMDGVDTDFEWSFLRQSGSLTTSAGVGEYAMPDGFNRVAGYFTYTGDDTAEKTVPVIPYGDVELMKKSDPTRSGKPRFAAVAAVKEFGEKGQKRKIYFFPTPDAAYTFSYVCDADQGKISASNPYPLGGVMYSELIVESCLAVAEQSVNDEMGLHTQAFNTLLASSIQRDRKAGAQIFGKAGDPKHRRFW